MSDFTREELLMIGKALESRYDMLKSMDRMDVLPTILNLRTKVVDLCGSDIDQNLAQSVSDDIDMQLSGEEHY